MQITKKRIINDNDRRGAPGSFIELSRGKINYDIAGPEEGILTVFLNGLSTPFYIWDKNFYPLTASGFRVLRYDYFGRGYCDRPEKIAYDFQLYEEQFLEMVEKFAGKAPVNLVGLSMGGLLSVWLTARHPDIVQKLCLVDPVGFYFKLNWLAKAMLSPKVVGLLGPVFGDAVVLKGVERDFYNKKLFPQYRDKFKPQLKFTGYTHAVTSSILNLFTVDSYDSYKRVADSKIPVLLIWGKKDKTLPFKHHKEVLAALPDAQFAAIDGAGHLPNYEQPEVVNGLLEEFLSR